MKNIVTIAFLVLAQIIASTEAIIGGRPTQPGEYTYIASFWNDTEHLCGGSIISDQHILTAAHCVYLDDVNFRDYPLNIVVGTNDLNDETAPNRVVTEVEKIYVSARYNHSYWWQNTIPYDDIAVLKLKDKLDIKNNPSISIINLPQKRFHSETYESYEDATGVLVGFGYDYLRLGVFDNGTNAEYGNSTRKLRQASLKVINHDKCGSRRLHDTMLCAKVIEHSNNATVQGACTGDSGGPLVYDNTLIAFVSASSFGCNDNVEAGWYTRVSSYVDFIERAMKDRPMCGMRVVTYNYIGDGDMRVVDY